MYVIVGDQLLDQMVLSDAWVELYPMVYGNETGTATDGHYDEAINFGQRPSPTTRSACSKRRAWTRPSSSSAGATPRPDARQIGGRECAWRGEIR